MQPSREAKNPKRPTFYSPVDPTTLNSSVGSTGASEKPSPSRTGVSQPVFFGKLDDWGIKSSPNLTNFVGTITKGLSTCPPKESTNHSMVCEESKKIQARTGFSQERKNFNSKKLVNLRVLGLG